MAGFAEMLQRLARELEQADAQRPEDDLRARLGYGPADDTEDVDHADGADAPESESIWGPGADATRRPDTAGEAVPVRGPAAAREPVTTWKPAAAREPVTAWKPAAAREPVTAWKPAVAREPVASRTAASAPAASRAPSPSPGASPHHRPPSGALPLERIRARLRTPDALREAFVVKALLDRPPGLRRR